MDRPDRSFLPGSPSGWSHTSPAALLGMSAGNQSRAAGAGLPPVTVTGGDLAMVPWHPDSPLFWFALLAAVTIVGLAGASIEVRGPEHTAVGAEFGRRHRHHPDLKE